MTQPTVASFGKGLVYVEDPSNPGTFNKICGFTKISLKLDKNFDTTTIPDCENPDAATWNGVEVSGMGWTFSFEGVFAKEGWPQLWNVSQIGVAAGVRIRILDFGAGSGNPDLQFSGDAHFSLGIDGQKGQKWSQTVSGTGDGALVAASVPALT